MRVHRITLTNFKGVADATVNFADEGVTIVEGENEAGKSTLIEALDLLLHEKSTSKKARVVATKPIGQDVGPQAEAELTIGNQRVTICKRWLNGQETVLTLHGSPDEVVTGGDGHDRLDALISAHVDRQLLSALQVLQGTKLDQATLASQALSNALDAVGGIDHTGQLEDGLWDRICTERNKFWTNTGLKPQERKKLDEEIDNLEGKRANLASELSKLDDDVARVARLTHEASKRRDRIDELTPEFEELGQVMTDVSALTLDLASAETRRQQAETNVRLAETEENTRHGLTNAVTIREANLKDLQDDASALSDQERLAKEVLHLTAARDAASNELRALQEAELKAADDERLRRDLLNLDLLDERLTKYQSAQSALSAAEETLRSTKIDAKLLDEIEAAFVEQLTAAGAAEDQAVAVEIEATTSMTVSGDDVNLTVTSGATERVDLVSPATVTVPGAGKILISPGRNVGELRTRRTAAEGELDRLLAQAGVASVSEARLAEQARVEAKRTADAQVIRIKDELRDLTPDSLSSLVNHLRESTAERLANRATSELLPPDVPGAEALHAAAAEAVRTADDKRSSAQAKLEEAVQEYGTYQTAVGEHRARVEQAETELVQAREQLSEARAAKSDEAMAAEREAADLALTAAEREVGGIEEQLKALDAESAKIRFDNLQKAIERAREESLSLREELLELTTSLKVRGEQGLASQLDDVDGKLKELTDERRRIDDRADAAELLYQTFHFHRSAAQERYRAPLRAEIERLGRIVFGENLSVTLSEDLTIAERTIDGQTVPFDQLSIGAQEQLGVIARLACASLVGDSGGAPVILDDALGWSDPGRLSRMGAALCSAAKASQVIVLTCFPDRYAAVGEARVVRLDP